jgi:hypothetical protein
MDQPYLQADPPTSLSHESREMGFETLSSIIADSIARCLMSPIPTLRELSISVMLDIAENGWEFHHDNWPGFTHSADDEECDG